MVFLQISQNSQESTTARVSFCSMKLQALGLGQVFSCEFCEISEKYFLIEHLCWLLLKILLRD